MIRQAFFRWTMRCWLTALVIAMAPHIAAAETQGIDSEQARRYFEEARKICESDAGKLWGKSLCGPMLFGDPDTRWVAANQPDAESRLKAQNGVFVGKLPDEVNIANTATSWAGVHWTMVEWPLPESPTVRARLMMHELFHRIQDDLGLPALSPPNAHLGTLEGRIWLRLEWRALQQALARPDSPPAERRRAVEDALLFRLRRQALFPKAEEEERELELNEGLAEYTGYKVRGTSDAGTVEAVIGRLSSAESEPAFSRSFAYVSGPAYGLLLDLSGKTWRKNLTSKSSLGNLLQQSYGVALPSDLAAAAEKRASVYDGVAVRWLETQQEEKRKAQLEDYKKRLITGPVLTLPVMEQFNFSFDPNGVIPIDDTSSAYTTLRVTDVWGVLEVSGGALIVRGQRGFVRVVVEAPKYNSGSAGEIKGNGWKLTLTSGWSLAKGDRPGDLTVAKKE
ncbi:MAG TPA: hypothetical protein VI431_07750 [Candidatus Acidoferrum sp.]